MLIHKTSFLLIFDQIHFFSLGQSHSAPLSGTHTHMRFSGEREEEYFRGKGSDN